MSETVKLKENEIDEVTGGLNPQPSHPYNYSGNYMGYIIQPGDTLAGIAYDFDTTEDKLASMNGISNKSMIYAGQNLWVPTKY